MFFSSQFTRSGEGREKEERGNDFIGNTALANQQLDDLFRMTETWCNAYSEIDGIEEVDAKINSLLPMTTLEHHHRLAKLLKRVTCARIHVQDMDEDEERLLETIMAKLIRHGIPADKALYVLVRYETYTAQGDDTIGLLIKRFFDNQPVFLQKEETINEAFIKAIEKNNETLISAFWGQGIQPMYKDAEALSAAILKMNLEVAERLIGMGAKLSAQKATEILLLIVKKDFVCLKCDLQFDRDMDDYVEPENDEWYSFAALRILLCFGANPNRVFIHVILSNNYKYFTFFKNLPTIRPLSPQIAERIFNVIAYQIHFRDKDRNLFDFRILKYLIDQGLDMKVYGEAYLRFALTHAKEKELLAFLLANGAIPTADMLVSACGDNDNGRCRLFVRYASEAVIDQAIRQDSHFRAMYESWLKNEWYTLRDVNEIVQQVQQEREQTEEQMRDRPIIRRRPESLVFLPLVNSILTQVAGRESQVRYRDYKRRMGEEDVESFY